MKIDWHYETNKQRYSADGHLIPAPVDRTSASLVFDQKKQQSNKRVSPLFAVSPSLFLVSPCRPQAVEPHEKYQYNVCSWVIRELQTWYDQD